MQNGNLYYLLSSTVKNMRDLAAVKGLLSAAARRASDILAKSFDDFGRFSLYIKAQHADGGGFRAISIIPALQFSAALELTACRLGCPFYYTDVPLYNGKGSIRCFDIGDARNLPLLQQLDTIEEGSAKILNMMGYSPYDLYIVRKSAAALFYYTLYTLNLKQSRPNTSIYCLVTNELPIKNKGK